MKNSNLIIQALGEGIALGGATVDKKGNIVLQGIVVAQAPEFETKLEYKHIKYVLPEIASWLNRIENFVCKGTHFGIWVDENGAIWLDLVQVLDVADITLAIESARGRGQRALQVLHAVSGINQTLWLDCPEK